MGKNRLTFEALTNNKTLETPHIYIYILVTDVKEFHVYCSCMYQILNGSTVGFPKKRQLPRCMR